MAIGAQLHAVDQVFSEPTLAMLNHRDAKIIVACLRGAFTAPEVTLRGTLPAPRLHRLISDYLAELVELGVFDASRDRDGAAWCRTWIKRGWLNTDAAGAGGNEIYALTANARSALTFVAANESDTLVATGTRVRVVQAEFHTLARQANPDRSARIADLNTEIGDRQAEIARLEGGGDVTTMGASELRGAIVLLRALSTDVGNDCVRLGERLDTRRRAIGRDLTGKRAGDILASSLDSITELLDQTPEGKLFADIVALFATDVDLDTMRANLDALLAAPAAQSLTAAERRDLRRIVDDLPVHIEPVIAARTRSVAALKTQLRRATGTELVVDQLLVGVENALSGWLATASSRSGIDIGIRPHRLEHGHLGEEFTTFAPAQDPEPAAINAPVGTLPDLSALRAMGGPSTTELRAAVATALEEAHTQERLGRSDGLVEADLLFNSLREELRRPVEIPGLLDVIGADTDYLIDTDSVVELHTLSNGQTRTFRTHRILFTRKDPTS